MVTSRDDELYVAPTVDNPIQLVSSRAMWLSSYRSYATSASMALLCPWITRNLVNASFACVLFSFAWFEAKIISRGEFAGAEDQKRLVELIFRELDRDKSQHDPRRFPRWRWSPRRVARKPLRRWELWIRKDDWRMCPREIEKYRAMKTQRDVTIDHRNLPSLNSSIQRLQGAEYHRRVIQPYD